MGVQIHTSEMKVTLLILCCATLAQSGFVTKKLIGAVAGALKGDRISGSSKSVKSSSSSRTSVPKEVCKYVQKPSVQYKTEKNCTSVPVTRQECIIKQEQECYYTPENECFDVSRNLTEVKEVEQCKETTEVQCREVSEQQCRDVQDRQCSEQFVEKCEILNATMAECTTTYEDECHTLPEMVCNNVTITVNDTAYE